MENKTKFCKWCGETIDIDCVVCPKCGKQVEELKSEKQDIVINNTSSVVTNQNKKKVPWYASWFWIILLSIITSGIYLIPGLILRAIWKSKN